ncbi:hypothetical protein [Longispora albida]|uniref:hypothetical protein n=1 Tax=Longispora albida TaxID=203523 RepID=UPI00037C69E4|nr:hypothetical protein [Longispora albida]
MILTTHEADGLHAITGLCLHDEGADEGDGLCTYWMVPGETYVLRHDGTSWTVTGGGWSEPGHTYRLTGGLPLDPARDYLLSRGGAGWVTRIGRCPAP